MFAQFWVTKLCYEYSHSIQLVHISYLLERRKTRRHKSLMSAPRSKRRTDSPVPLAEAIQVSSLGSHTYAVELQQCFCIGTVPNGGYVASTLLEAAHTHLLSRRQPDTLTAHFEFLNRTEAGPAVIVVQDVKVGRQLSVLHLTLYQRGLLPKAPWITPGKSRKELVAYVTNGDIASEQGVSAPTSFFPLLPAVQPVDLTALARGEDKHWYRMPIPEGPFGRIRALKNMEYYAPRAGQPERSRADLWVRLVGGGRFANASLGYVADAWPYIVEQYRPPFPETAPFRFDQAFWYPTVVLNLEAKKQLPAEGVEWLALRVTSKQIKNGRLDVEVAIMDASGELVALSQHVNMVLDASRNLAERADTGKL